MTCDWFFKNTNLKVKKHIKKQRNAAQTEEWNKYPETDPKETRILIIWKIIQNAHHKDAL